MHSHKLVTPGLASLPGDLSYLDIEFVFSGNEDRKAQYRLVFCPPSLDPVAAETMHGMLGADVYTLCVSVVSFVDMIQLDREQEQLQNPVLAKNQLTCLPNLKVLLALLLVNYSIFTVH